MNAEARSERQEERKTGNGEGRGTLTDAISAIGSVIFGIPKFLIEQYPQLPRRLKPVIYVTFLLLFVYLLMLPRFVDGQLIVRDPNTGGVLPYRGVDLQIQVDGRPYKFRSNEEGFFSVPIVGRWPSSLGIQIFHQDRKVWFDVEFSIHDLWLGGNHRIEVLAEKPYVQIVAQRREPEPTTLLADLLLRSVGTAHAQSIVLPRKSQTVNARLSDREQESIKKAVELEYANVAHKQLSRTGSPTLLGDSTRSMSYVQRIQLVRAVEQKFKITIPDEHWQQMDTVAQLADYVEKRKQLERSAPAAVKDATSWVAVQREFSPGEKPIYQDLKK